MLDTSKRQFIFKDGTGRVVNLYFSERHGICCSTLTKRNTWTEPECIIRNVYHEFYACMGEDDSHHVLCQDISGNILYLCCLKGTWHKFPILGSKASSPGRRYPYIILAGRKSSLFYVLPYEGKMLLAHQLFDTGKTGGMPKVIDYVSQESLYSITLGEAGDILAFYSLSDGKCAQIVYKVYSTEAKSWSRVYPVTEQHGNCEGAQAITDGEGVLHLVFKRRIDRQVEILYMWKPPGASFKKEPVTVCSVGSFINNLSILSVKGVLIIYWLKDGLIYHCQSIDNGTTWSKPSEYSFPDGGRPLHAMVYKTNFEPEMNKIYSGDIPGVFVGGYRLAFIHEALRHDPELLSPYELKALVTDTLSTLSKKLDSMEELYSAIGFLQKEVTKNSIRLGMLEEKLKSLRDISGNAQKSEAAGKRPLKPPAKNGSKRFLAKKPLK